MTLPAQIDSVLTPDVARSLVRQAALSTGSFVFDDDLVGEALLRGVIAFQRTVHVTHARAFFSKIVKDTVRDYWRRRRAWIPLECIGEITQVVDFEERLDRRRQLERLRAALIMLPADQRTLLELFYLDEMSIGQISAVLQKSRSALKMALLRGRKNIVQVVTAKSAVPARIPRQQ